MTRRTAGIGGVIALWVVAIGVWSAPRTIAGPSSPPAVVPDAAFAPVLVPRTLSSGPDGAEVARTTSDIVATPDVLGEAGAPPVPTDRPGVRQPAARVGVFVKPPPVVKAPRASGGGGGAAPRTSHSLRGNASWYCKAGVSICMAAHPDRAGVADLYAAAGPRLRRAICGSDTSNCWRNRRVVVDGVTVVLADWCQCYKGRSNEKIIDLYWDAWVRVPGVENGVTIRW